VLSHGSSRPDEPRAGWARIRAVGANGAGAWSDPATILVA